MPGPLTCFYLDAPLDDDELAQVAQALIGHFAKFKSGASHLQQKRVPFLVPAPPVDGKYADSREERAQQVAGNLRHAGIQAEAGRQVLWVTPRADAPAAEWDAIFQFAIRRETGIAPYVVQRAPIRVIDTQMLFKGLE